MLSLTANTPKPLLEHNGKSILQWNLENMPREISEVIFVIGYLGREIRYFVQNSILNKKITFIEQKELNGTGGALALCKDKLGDKFLIINGDDLYNAGDLSRLMAHKLAILGHWSRDWPGSSLLVDQDQNLIGIESNPPPQEEKIACSGAYLLDKRFFNYPLATIKNGKEFSIPHTLITMSRDHKIFVEKATFWKQINKPEDLSSAGGTPNN